MARKKNIAAGLDAVIYARYSSHNQREVSIEQQIAECTKHAAALGLRIVGTYEDRAISGKTDNRPRFQQMMRDAEKGKFQAVVAWKSNRIGRNMLQAMVNEAKLDDYGVKVFYAEEDFDDTAAGRFALRNMMNVNQFYSENMAEDITRGLYDNANKCMANGRQPLGYKRGADGKVMLDEPAAAVVREIFARVAAGDLFVDIARDLNAKGIKTSKGAVWNKGSFQSICQNERYKGIYIYGDVRIVDGIPRIVSDELWYKVQEAMRMKKNPVGTRHRVGAEDYLLTGKLCCGHCGSYMTGISGTSRNGELHYYYTCQKRRTEHACNKKNVRRDVIEPAIAQAIKMYCLTDDVIEWMADQTVQYWEKHDNDLQIEALEQQLAENKKATSNMLKAIEMGIITEATRSRMVELETENSKLTAQLSAAKRDVVKINREDLIDELHILRGKDIHDREVQAELFKDFLVAAYIYDDNRLKLVFSFMGKDNSVEIPLETGEDPPDGGDSPDAKMFVLPLECSTRKRSTTQKCVVLFCCFLRKKAFVATPQSATNAFTLLCAQTHFEVLITEMHQLPAAAVCAQQPDGRQGHPVEGVVLAGGVDGHIAKDELIPLGKRNVKAVIPDDIPRKAGGAAQPDGARLLPCLTGIQQRRAVGHLNDVRGVAGCGHIQNGKAGISIVQGVQHGGNQIARVQRPSLAGLQIHLHAVLLPHREDAAFQRIKGVARAGDVVPAAEVEPLHLGQQVCKFFLHRCQRHRQRIRVLLAQGVEVQTVQQGGQLRVRRHGGVPLGTGGAQTAAGGAGVVDFVTFLRGALRVDAQTNAFARCLCRRAELCQLAGRVEHDMVSVLQ